MAEGSKTTKGLLLTIFITVFIDLLGVSIIIPVIPAIFFEQNSQFFSGPITDDQKSLIYSFLLMCYPLAQFFGAPLLGSLSDRNGRKPILSMALIGTMIGYFLFAYAIYIKSVPLLFISRIIPGFTGGNISIILSSIADVSTKEERTSNFGLVGMAFGLGFILGPVVGGILSDDTILPWFNHMVPFIFTGLLTILNIILVRFFFKETLKKRTQSEINIFAGFKNVKNTFRTPALRNIFIIVLLLSVGFTFFTNFYSAYLYDEFQFSEKNIGYLYGWIGLWLAFTQGFIVRKLSKLSNPKKVLLVSIPFIGIGIGLLLLPTEAWVFYLINPIIAIAQGTTSPNMNSIVSEQVSEELQGSIMGINQSMQSLGQIIPTAIGGILLAQSKSLPLAVGALVIGFAFIGYLINYRKIRYE